MKKMKIMRSVYYRRLSLVYWAASFALAVAIPLSALFTWALPVWALPSMGSVFITLGVFFWGHSNRWKEFEGRRDSSPHTLEASE
jgi:hypothetical protein